VTLFVVGVSTLYLTWLSWNHSREGWSFLIAVTGVFGGVTLFGSPKVAQHLGVGLWTAMIDPSIKVAAIVALASLRREYRRGE